MAVAEVLVAETGLLRTEQYCDSPILEALAELAARLLTKNVDRAFQRALSYGRGSYYKGAVRDGLGERVKLFRTLEHIGAANC